MDSKIVSREVRQASRRAQKRTRLFVTANLSSASMRGRVRNMSASGALFEAADLPAIGERVKLRKGELKATGKVVRHDVNQAGILFERLINPIDWLPNKAGSQLMVDAAFQTIKPIYEGGPLAANQRVNARAAAGALPFNQTSRDELEGIADILDALADKMSEDPVIIASYLDKLQVLDVASQKLRKVGRDHHSEI